MPCRFCFFLSGPKPVLGWGLQETATAWEVPHAGWSVSEKFSYQQNFPTPNSGAWGRSLPRNQSLSPDDAHLHFAIKKPPK
ncbi:MAG: hypothetical protein EXS37_07720 [Opitutus sp.]|nr:hypothetical protein [Opitutus sp.]